MSDPRPPRLAEWLLARALPERDRDAVLGDLDEAMRGPDAPRWPRVWYWLQATLFAAGFAWARVSGRLEHDTGYGRHDRGRGNMVDAWMAETRLSIRALRRRPGFSATVVGTLALGLGATTAIFSVVHGSLMTPLPYPDADRVVWLSEWFPERASAPGGSSLNDANIVHFQETLRSVEGIAPYALTSMNLAGGDRPQRIRGLGVEHRFLGTLGIQPELGRDFLPEDDVVDGPNVMILTHGLWSDLFAADPGILGTTVEANDEPYTVIGVLPEEFDFMGGPRMLFPLGFHGREYPQGGRQYYAIGRLAEGATLEAAQDEIQTAYLVRAEAYEGNEGWSAWVSRLGDQTVGSAQRRSLYLLGWAVAAVLLVACLNVANLLLVRAESRQRELAVRVALGAGRGRLAPHFLSEGLILSTVGGILGVGVGYIGVEAIRRAFSGMIPRPEEISIDPMAVGFAAGLTLLVGLIVGVVPMVRVRRLDLQSDLREGGRGAAASGSRLRQTLVVSEIALAVVILSTAGLLGNSFYRVARIDVGLEAPEDVLVAQIALGARYESNERVSAFTDEVMDRIAALPGVTAVGVTSRLPLYGGSNFTSVAVLGDADRSAPFVEWRVVTPGLFEGVGLDLEEGRLFDREDAASDTLRTILVSRELARQLFPGERAVGRRIDPFQDDVGLEIVGVVADLRDFGHEEPAPPAIYAPQGAASANRIPYLVVRSETDPLSLIPPVRAILQELDPNLPLFGGRTLQDVVDQRLGARRFSVSLLFFFALAALLLGAIGIYGVMSYSVAQRTREMGVRLALGAGRSEVVRMVVRHGLALTLLGIVVGLAGARISSRWIASQLFEVSASDPLTYAVVTVALGSAALAASYLPARRASRTDPLEALRSD